MRSLTVAGALSVLLGAAIGVRAAPAANPEAAQLPVIEAVNADEVNFGGVYVDKDGTLGIQYVGGNAGRAAVERTVTAGVAVRWEKVEHSRSELKQITAKIKALDLEEVVSISAGTSRNEVIVTVGPKG